MRLVYAAGTRDYLRTLAPGPRKAVRDALRLIESDPRHKGLALKQLRRDAAASIFRVRVAKDYRIVYSPRADHTYVWRIMHRSEGYAWLDRLDP